MALLTPTEQNYIELKLSLNWIQQNPKYIECVNCLHHIERKSLTTPYISCRLCEKNLSPFEFCIKCCQKWKNNKNSQDCGNSGCKIDHRLAILSNAQKIQIRDHLLPSIRCCPNCGILIEKDEKPTYCKTINCLCGMIVCFICLSFCNKESIMSPCYEKGNTNDKNSIDQNECIPKTIQEKLSSFK